MGAPAGYSTVQVRKDTIVDLGWVAEQLGVSGSRGKVVEDLARWAMTPDGLKALRAWKAREIERGGHLGGR